MENISIESWQSEQEFIPVSMGASIMISMMMMMMLMIETLQCSALKSNLPRSFVANTVQAHRYRHAEGIGFKHAQTELSERTMVCNRSSHSY